MKLDEYPLSEFGLDIAIDVAPIPKVLLVEGAVIVGAAVAVEIFFPRKQTISTIEIVAGKSFGQFLEVLLNLQH